MGVKGLWQLLLPTGRRISIETLSGKRLAIDASIWLTQFLKANRDPETGAVRPNAHIIGFLRRICKLLFHGIKPVFVFDGATPEIKLREIRARKERRDRLNCFKSDDDNEGVKRLARRILVARLKRQKEFEKAKNQVHDVEFAVESGSGSKITSSDGTKTEGAFASGFRLCSSRNDDNNEHETNMEKEGNEMISDSKGVSIIDDERKDICITDNEDYLQRLTYEEEQINNDWDDALAAAESASDDSVTSNDDSDKESTLDLHVLTSLPAKSRVDVIEKARRHQRMQSRKEFMSVAADPHSYSQCQLKNFLKSANLNRQVHKLGEIDAISCRGGLEGERIASDSTRRFIFTKGEAQSYSISRQASDKNPMITSSPENRSILLHKRKDGILYEAGSEVENGGGFINDGNVDHYDDQSAAGSLDQSCDNQGGFIPHVDDEDMKNKYKARHEIEESSTDSFSDASVPDHDLQSRRHTIDEKQQYESNTFGIDTSNHMPGSVPKVTDTKPCTIEANSSVSMNQYINDLRNDEEIFCVSNAPRKHLNEIETFRIVAAINLPDVAPKVVNKEPSIMIDNSAMMHSPCIDDQHKGEAIIDASMSTHKYPTCAKYSEESRSNISGEENIDDGDDDIEWEDGDDTGKDNFSGNYESCHKAIEDTSDYKIFQAKCEDFGTAISKKRVHSPDYENDMEDYEIQTLNTEIGHHDHASLTAQDSDKKGNNNANAAALLSAHATASQLTDWAGRVVRQAIQMHLGERVDEVFRKRTESDSCSPSEDESLQNDHSVKCLSEHISTESQTDYLGELRDTSLEALQRQDDILREEDNRRERDMDTVTEEMVEDVMFLLTLFGIPYLRAPAEAEAQAVELEKLGLVDGVVTEDSDAIVFGSRSVYRNIFDDKKYVELYLSSDSDTIGIGYNEKIALAMLLGGDYTQGVKGVGIVNGMEILKAFPVSESVLDGLTAFRNWLDGFELDEKTNSDNSIIAEFTKKHKSARSRWLLPSNFPSAYVLQAYTRPIVDSSQTKFSWGVPDLDAIRMFLRKKVGWEVSEINRIILPVTRAMEEAKTQKKIDGYFMRSEDNIKFADVRSKRLRRVWELDKRTESENEKEQL
jgi:DNA excision repair protein ERCC-5